MKFTVEIELGNEAMDSPYDVQHALTLVATRVRQLSDPDWKEASGKVFDANGNSVGVWKFEEN
jgi:hypothetical protein